MRASPSAVNLTEAHRRPYNLQSLHGPLKCAVKLWILETPRACLVRPGMRTPVKQALLLALLRDVMYARASGHWKIGEYVISFQGVVLWYP